MKSRLAAILTLVYLTSLVPSLYALWNGDRLDLAITPIRSDIQVTLNWSTQWSVTLYNNSDQAYSFRMSAEDCTVTADYKAPLCNPTSGSGVTVNSLASWISFETNDLFTIAPKWNRKINYTINTPSGAIPGGHYGAIFFNSPENSNVTGGSISMNRRIGSLLLVTVPGDIVVAPEFGSVLVDTAGPGGSTSGAGGGSTGTPFFSFDDNGPLIEQLTNKWSRAIDLLSAPETPKKVLDFFNPMWSTPEITEQAPFGASIGLPVSNKWTIHIVPTGKITLYNTDGTQLLHIGKEIIKNQAGAIIGERVVDYLTINDGEGNVLPGTDRVFTTEWLGFAQESRWADGRSIVSYKTPWEYYSNLAQSTGFIYPWEKLSLEHITLPLEAQVDLSYINPLTKEIVNRNSKIPITVQYDQITKTLNTGLISTVAIIGSILYLGFWRRRSLTEEVISHLVSASDEISVLEEARSSLMSRHSTKITTSSKNSPVKKVTPAKPVEKPAGASMKKSPPQTKETPAKPVKKAPRKIPATENKTTSKSTSTRAPAKKTVVKKTPVTKTVSKEK